MVVKSVRILLLVSLLWGGVEGTALGQSAGQVLPELSGRGIGPGDDPRLKWKARLRRQAKKARLGHEIRRRSRPRYRTARLKSGGWRFYGAGWTADVAVDGSLSFDKRSVTWSTKKMQWTFDGTDAVQRGRKKDPYAAAKLRFMVETAAWRRSLLRAAKRRARRAYFERLPSRLRALWKRSDLSFLRKRWLLFELWEECLEPGRSTDTVRAQQARWTILRFIQKHLPSTSNRRFTRRELSWMQKRRRGRIRFDPYGRHKRPLLPQPIDTTR